MLFCIAKKAPQRIGTERSFLYLFFLVIILGRNHSNQEFVVLDNKVSKRTNSPKEEIDTVKGTRATMAAVIWPSLSGLCRLP